MRTLWVTIGCMFKGLEYMRTKTITVAACCIAASTLVSGCSTSYFDHLHKGPDFIESEAADTSTVDEAPAAHTLQPDNGLAPEEGAIIPPKDAWDECPYLPTEWVADTNGQKVLGVGLDTRFDTPACVFWSYPDQPQLQVIVRHMAAKEDAIAAVNHYAPIEWTSPALKPQGWDGGRGSWNNEEGVGSVYSVQKGPVAVTVLSNQEQTIKPATVAEEVIRNLQL